MKYTPEELLKYAEENELVELLYHAMMGNDFGYMHMPTGVGTKNQECLLVFSLFFHKSFRKAVLIYTEEQIIMRRTGNDFTRQKDGRRARFPHIDKAGGIQWITIKMITAAMAKTRGRTVLAEIIIRL